MNLDGNNDKPRLTAEQKKKNHIESEKKRREAIRAGFEKLADIVPGVQGQGRSEAVVLQATVQYLREMLGKKAELATQAEARGMSEGDFEQVYREVENDYRLAVAIEPEEEDEEDPQEGPSNARR